MQKTCTAPPAILSLEQSMVLQLVPTREAFEDQLGPVSKEQLHLEMKSFLDIWQPVLADVQAFLVKERQDDQSKV